MPLDTTVSSTSLRPAYDIANSSSFDAPTPCSINTIQSTSAQLIEVVTMEFVSGFTEVVSMDLGPFVEVVSMDFGPPPLPPPPMAAAAAQGEWTNKEMPSTSEEMPIRSSSTSSWFERVCDFVKRVCDFVSE